MILPLEIAHEVLWIHNDNALLESQSTLQYSTPYFQPFESCDCAWVYILRQSVVLIDKYRPLSVPPLASEFTG